MKSPVLPVVVVPVFNAYDALTTCLESLLKTLPRQASVLLADDASTDARIPDLLLQFKEQAPFQVEIVRREKNIGFPSNCNLAFEEAGDHDVLLLNSDTIFTRGCLQRIAECAVSEPAIATITPWSNNAEICSYPKFCEKNPLPDNLELVAAAAALMKVDRAPDLPTAIGFCMWISRAALKQCG
ncbi:MAG: glycosyltransferase, partial [Arenimonas sp.]